MIHNVASVNDLIVLFDVVCVFVAVIVEQLFQ